MDNIAHPDLIAEITAFCEAQGVSKATFGKAALGDPRFVYDLEAGRQCLPRTVNRARAFIAEHAAQPAGGAS